MNRVRAHIPEPFLNTNCLLQGYQPASNVAGLLGPFKQLLWQDGGCASFSLQLQLLLLSSSLFCVKTCCPAQQSKALYLGQEQATLLVTDAERGTNRWQQAEAACGCLTQSLAPQKVQRHFKGEEWKIPRKNNNSGDAQNINKISWIKLGCRRGCQSF
ncbi:TPA: hypothetical protein ACH3X3_001464 [Trebouxia sp. C0006]